MFCLESTFLCIANYLASLDPCRSLFKMLKRGESMQLDKYFAEALEKYDLTSFIVPCVNTLLDCLNGG